MSNKVTRALTPSKRFARGVSDVLHWPFNFAANVGAGFVVAHSVGTQVLQQAPAVADKLAPVVGDFSPAVAGVLPVAFGVFVLDAIRDKFAIAAAVKASKSPAATHAGVGALPITAQTPWADVLDPHAMRNRVNLATTVLAATYVMAVAGRGDANPATAFGIVSAVTAMTFLPTVGAYVYSAGHHAVLSASRWMTRQHDGKPPAPPAAPSKPAQSAEPAAAADVPPPPAPAL